MNWFDIFLSISEVIIPEGERDSGAKGEKYRERAKEFFDNMPREGRLIFSTICILINLNSIIRYFKPFPKLSIEKKEKIIRSWENSRIMRKRTMFSAIKGLVSLIFMSIEDNVPELKREDEICLLEKNLQNL